jgi:hypothetical protein
MRALLSVRSPRIGGRWLAGVKTRIRHEQDTHPRDVLCSNGCMRRERKPTVRQVYALAAALCERAGEEFPESFEAASELIERLRVEAGHPQPRLEDVPFRVPRRGRGRSWARRGDGRASAVAAELAREMR